MENSFFEYRDETNGDGESSCEIDDSIMDESFAPKKTPAKKNVTVFVPESDDSVSEDLKKRPSVASAFATPKKVILSSSEDEAKISLSSDTKSLKYDTSNMSYESINSDGSNDDSDEDDDYEESDKEEAKINDSKVDKIRYNRSNNDDKDQDFSKNKNIANISTDNVNNQTHNDVYSTDSDASVDYDNDNENYKSNDHSDIADNKQKRRFKGSVQNTDNDTVGTVDYDENAKNTNENVPDENIKDKDVKSSVNSNDNDTDGTEDYDYSKGDEAKDKSNKSDDDFENDDQMFMSRATRMSIMGIVPKVHESDESDYIQSDNVITSKFLRKYG
ncbi:protein starmaker-like [Zerene cesonia]|uniref:protein starmaker-like n=1 Tax=Zerene cesonia TaxID=33412 RepID=UPI0018E573AA|nr:protein starmaker-like [Zerene cesonia]